MIVVTFRNRMAPRVDPAEYEARAARLFEIASGLPGFVSMRDYAAPDGERLALVEFESHEALKAWREHPEHREAQRLGRERYYAEYQLQICELVRESRHPEAR